MFQDVKDALNHKDNLSMLDNSSNIGKAKLAANPNSQPAAGAAAKDYMNKQDVQDKASATMDKLTAIGNKHGQPSVRITLPSLPPFLLINLNSSVMMSRNGSNQTFLMFVLWMMRSLNSLPVHSIIWLWMN